jgi:hypothetical protein
VRGSLCAFLALAATVPGPAALSQERPERWQPEARVESVISRTTALHAAAGANTILGGYLRLAVLGAAGTRRVGDEWRPSGRVDVVGRFHVDPQRQFPRGWYLVGGATALLDDGVRTRVRAVVGVGLESRSYGSGWIIGAEGGFGGGGRLALTARRARRQGR